PTAPFAAATQPRGRITRFFGPAALAALVAAVVLVVSNPPQTIGNHDKSAKSAHKKTRKLRPYWIVRQGDTLANISAKTGLSLAHLEAYNPTVDPQSIMPGERLLLWSPPPKPRPKPLGPRFWRVRPGESFGSIAASTGINITLLQRLNPGLRPSTLQPGD